MIVYTSTFSIIASLSLPATMPTDEFVNGSGDIDFE